MMLIFMISIVIMMLSMLMMFLVEIISKSTIIDREKSSSFECGFDPKSSSRLPFSLRFFLITIIFLIFDVEIALILPIILIIKFSNMMMLILSSIFFIFILLLGLYYEWNKGMLNWSN